MSKRKAATKKQTEDYFSQREAGKGVPSGYVWDGATLWHEGDKEETTQANEPVVTLVPASEGNLPANEPEKPVTKLRKTRTTKG